jgi:hypothetical protein
MIWFKACPRCKVGDLALSEDIYGKYQQCFQCGHVIYPKDSTGGTSLLKGAKKREPIAA